MGKLSGEGVSVTAHLINPSRSAPGPPRGAAGAAGRRGRPRGTAVAPASWSPRRKSDPLRSEHLLRQRRRGRSEGEAAPTASPKGCVMDSPASPAKSRPDGQHGPASWPRPSRPTSDARHLFAQNTSTPTDMSSFPVPPSPPGPKPKAHLPPCPKYYTPSTSRPFAPWPRP